MCLVDKKEPSYTISSSIVKSMFSTLSLDRISVVDYDLSNPKYFIMDSIHVLLNCIKLPPGPDDTLAIDYDKL